MKKSIYNFNYEINFRFVYFEINKNIIIHVSFDLIFTDDNNKKKEDIIYIFIS